MPGALKHADMHQRHVDVCGAEGEVGVGRCADRRPRPALVSRTRSLENLMLSFLGRELRVGDIKFGSGPSASSSERLIDRLPGGLLLPWMWLWLFELLVGDTKLGRAPSAHCCVNIAVAA